MKIHECEQGTEEWKELRLGVVTASTFSKLITPKTGVLSASCRAHAIRMCAEQAFGAPLEDASSPWMDRGNAQEDEARKWYAFDRGVEVRQVGFVSNDAVDVGGSPDGFVGEDGGLEIKVPAALTHIGYLLDPDSLKAKYRPQVQGLLWITGRTWWDLMSYSPPPTKNECSVFSQLVVRCERDGDYIAKLENAVALFLERLDETMIKLDLRPANQERDE